ncbi:hypothetical protein NE237_010190 [Protea cynaroides]|uniref:Uncharacterized protein n=1 Tax=Protea cynaroides TaxID=273540 RepID=A0A9Q0R1F8_9MAGN|nr:hypothetical protein NE237_010190 [Protea cynaroides]
MACPHLSSRRRGGGGRQEETTKKIQKSKNEEEEGGHYEKVRAHLTERTGIIIPAAEARQGDNIAIRHDPRRHTIPASLVAGCEEGRFVLDDGSGVIELVLSKDSLPQEWKTGMYVMVVGLYVARSTGDFPLIKVHKIVDLSPFPDREALWLLEVIEANKLFYLSSSEE